MPLPVRRLSALVALPAALVLAGALTACSSDGGGGGGGDDDLSYEDSPLNKVFSDISSWSDMSEEEMQALNEEQNRKVEELVAACMAEQGFDYEPNVQSAGVSYSSEQYEGMEPLEYAQQYGYGMTTWEDTPTGQEMSQQEPDEYVDPNADVYETMSETERAAWDAALWGAPQEYDEEADAESYEYDWESAGCYGSAQHQIYEVDSPDAALIALQQDPQYAELFDGMNDLYTNLASDPKMSDLNSKWSSCMADAGYPGFSTVDDAMNSINEAQNALYEDVDEDAWADPSYTGPDLTELKTQEIATATADFTCRAEIDYEDESLRIQFELEQEFLDQNRDAIDSYVAAAQAARG